MNRMKSLRAEKGISMRDAAKCLHMPYTTYVNYEKGEREPNSETLIAIATFYGTSIDYLLGKTSLRHYTAEPMPDNIIPMPKMRRIPLLGTIACGDPILAQENFDGDVDLPENIHADFALRCRGDISFTSALIARSMTAISWLSASAMKPLSSGYTAIPPGWSYGRRTQPSPFSSMRESSLRTYRSSARP